MAEEKKTNDKKHSVLGFRIFIIVAAVLFVYFFAAARGAYQKSIEVQREVAEVRRQIREENDKRIKLKKQYKVVEDFADKMSANDNDPVKAFGVLKDGSQYTETDSLVEETARKKLGYVKPNEIIFVDKNK